MDAFEEVVAEILWNKGYWVRTSFKVKLEKNEKEKIGLPSTPRRELDVIAYNGQKNILKMVECKSYFDSKGVQFADITDPTREGASRYKMFHSSVLREVVF